MVPVGGGGETVCNYLMGSCWAKARGLRFVYHKPIVKDNYADLHFLPIGKFVPRLYSFNLLVPTIVQNHKGMTIVSLEKKIVLAYTLLLGFVVFLSFFASGR